MTRTSRRADTLLTMQSSTDKTRAPENPEPLERQLHNRRLRLAAQQHLDWDPQALAGTQLMQQLNLDPTAPAFTPSTTFTPVPASSSQRADIRRSSEPVVVHHPQPNHYRLPEWLEPYRPTEAPPQARQTREQTRFDKRHENEGARSMLHVAPTAPVRSGKWPVKPFGQAVKPADWGVHPLFYTPHPDQPNGAHLLELRLAANASIDELAKHLRQMEQELGMVLNQIFREHEWSTRNVHEEKSALIRRLLSEIVPWLVQMRESVRKDIDQWYARNPSGSGPSTATSWGKTVAS
ncbi:hypothetical protein M8818_003153 [Zalaria obscura]|uniref:Uncharacterized protein n=1 Tax=Zalaria obscura TaxID=2024903 RepID=A0ACC3SFT8_9PEZI